MKKIATVLVILTVSFGISVFAQDKVVQNENDTQQVQTEAVDTAAAPTLAAIDQEQQEEAEAKPTFHQVLKQKFIEGGVGI
jgi:hypothetical protein